MFHPLEEALLYQHKLRAVDPQNAFGSITRLEKLLKRLESTKGKLLYTRALAQSNRASELVEVGDTISAISFFKDALTDLVWINTQLPGSSYADPGEAIRIRKLLDRLETVDLAEEVARYTDAGKSSYGAGDWDSAERSFEQALVLQESINLNMPDSDHVRWRLVQELKDFQRRIEAARMNDRIEALLLTGGEAEDLERSLKLQELLNERYPNTEFYDLERVDSLRQKLVSDQSESMGALLTEQVDQLDWFIKERKWKAVEAALLEAEGLLTDFLSRYSLSLLPDPSMQEKITWLVSKSEQLEQLVAEVSRKLISHPTHDLQIFSTEVDQALYRLVMDENPSRWAGDDFPVDSVGFDQAQEFCRRLGWAAGRPVTLPKISWISVFDVNSVEEKELWFGATSGFRSQATGSSIAINGTYEVFGNLAEWVVDQDDQGNRGLFGGSGAESLAKVKIESVIWVAPHFRSRWAGFRFCVQDR